MSEVKEKKVKKTKAKKEEKTEEIPVVPVSQSEPGGNTKPPAPPSWQGTQFYLWMITLKCGDETAEDLSQNLKTFCKKFTFQKESGKSTGYIHWQIYISLIQKERFRTLKNLFPNAAHIEPARNGWAASKYCEKSDTRIEGPYNEESVFIKIITDLYPWQKKVEEMCLIPPDDRTINWIWDEEGCNGKTQLCKYMAVKHNATLLGNGSFKDLASALPETPKIVLFNVTRGLEERFNYSAIEAIKDGVVFSGKYKSSTKIFNSPHLFVFANFAPDLNAISKDRWNIINISKPKNVKEFFEQELY